MQKRQRARDVLFQKAVILSLMLVISAFLRGTLVVNGNTGWLSQDGLHRSIAPTAASVGAQLKTSGQLFSFVDVTVIVSDIDGTPVKGAEVKALSLNWGVMYPRAEEWGLADSSGVFRFRIPVGDWSFVASSGSDYSKSHPGKGFFAIITERIYEDSRLSLRPQNNLQVELTDENGSPLQVDELFAVSTDCVPAIPPALVGLSATGLFTLYVGGEAQNLTLIAMKYSSKSSDGYVLVRSVWVGRHHAMSAKNSAEMVFTAYDVDKSLSQYWNVELRLPDLYVGNWVRSFQVYGKSVVHVSPTKVVLNPRFMPPGWYYYFDHIAVELKEQGKYAYSFGGKVTFKLWVMKELTQLHFDARDEFGNVLAFYSGPDLSRHIRLKVYEDGSEVYGDDIGPYMPATLFYALGRTFSASATFSLEVDFGPFGGLSYIDLAGGLYGEEYRPEFTDVQTKSFNIHMPVEYFWIVSGEPRGQVFVDALDTVYASIGNFTEEVLGGRPHKCEINFGWCGVGGLSFVGFGVGVARWPVHVHHGYLGVLSHELGHMYSFTPPLRYSTGWPSFFEPLATYLGIEGVARLYGQNVRLWYWGTHPGFFDYLAGDSGVGEIERMQFLLFYIHSVYGPESHRHFFKAWSNGLQEILVREGFDDVEAVCTLYSYTVRENLASMFHLAGFSVSEEKVAGGVQLMVQALTTTTSITVRTTVRSTETTTKVTTETATKYKTIYQTTTQIASVKRTRTVTITLGGVTTRTVGGPAEGGWMIVTLGLAITIVIGFAMVAVAIMRRGLARSVEGRNV